MQAVKVATLEKDERSGEIVALLNMISYAQAIAHDLNLSTSEFILSNVIDDLSSELAKAMHCDVAVFDVASLAIGKTGRC